MVGICDAFAIGAVSLGRRRCPGPLLGLVFSACSGVVLQSVRVGVVVLGSLVLAVWIKICRERREKHRCGNGLHAKCSGRMDLRAAPLHSQDAGAAI